jgi:hypothetical protein
VQERRRMMAEQRITLERYLQVVGQTEADFRAELRPQAERQLKARLVLDELAEREGISVDPAQIAEEIERTAQQYGEQADQVRRSLSSDEGRRRVSTSLRRHLAIQRLVGIGGGYPQDELGVLSGDGESAAAEAGAGDARAAGGARDAEGAAAAGDADTGAPVAATQLQASDAGAADVTETVADAGTGGESASAGGAGGVIER